MAGNGFYLIYTNHIKTKTKKQTRQTPYFEVYVRALDLPEEIKRGMLQGKPLSPIAVRLKCASIFGWPSDSSIVTIALTPQHRMAVEAAARYKTRMVLSLLGLKRCADTIVRPCGSFPPSPCRRIAHPLQYT